MKILQINANYGIGSTGLIVKDIGEMITKSGNEAYYAYQKSNSNEDNSFRVGNILDWKIHAVMCRILGGQGYYSRIATHRLIANIVRIKPDVVHLHNLHSNFVNIDILLKFLAKEDIATVITMHDCWYFTGKCFHYIDCNCDKFMVGCGNCPKKSAPPKSYLFDWSKFSLENKKNRLLSIPRLKIVGCSNWICNEAHKSILSNCDIEPVYNGVDVSIFCPTSSSVRKYHNVGNDFLVMGMANKWLLDENIDMLKKVSSLENVSLMIVGCTNEQKKIISEIDDRVIKVGFIDSREELAKYYSAADVFVNLTHADTLPTVNMESICCGTPVITYNSCGSPELLNENTGIIVEENDKNSIIKAIKLVSESSFNECRQVGVCRFDKTKCYERYIEIYRDLVEKAK